MPAAPTNIRTTKADIDGSWVEQAWDDPNADTATVRFWNVVSGVPGTIEQSFTRSVTLKRAVMPAGTWAVSLKSTSNNESTKAMFTTDAATTPAPTLTEVEHLEVAIGAVNTGDRVAVFAATADQNDSQAADWFDVGTTDVVPGPAPAAPPPPPVLTQEQMVEQGLGITLAAGEQVAFAVGGLTVKTVQANGSVT